MLCRSVFTVTVKALWVVVMYTMNNRTYNGMQYCDSQTYKALYLSYLESKDTTQSLWEMLGSLLKNCCCHKSVVDAWDVLQSSVARQ